MAKRKTTNPQPQSEQEDSARVRIMPGDKVDLVLTIAEFKLLREDLSYLDPDLDDILRKASPGQPIRMTLDDLDQLSGCVAAEANHTKDKNLAKSLDRIFGKITHLLDRFSDAEPAATLKIEDAEKVKLMAEQAAGLKSWAAKVNALLSSLRVKSKVVDTFAVGTLERAVFSTLPGLAPKLQRKAERSGSGFTAAEVMAMAEAIGERLPQASTPQQLGLLYTAKTLMETMQAWIANQVQPPTPRTTARAASIYQFKITLLESKPPIWRRIQIEDCTLDEFHQHIQTAMGWTNSHLHQFEIGGKRYGDPELLDEGFDDFECIDSTRTKISKILPKSGKRFRFKYEYDFGDGWEHEVVFEGCPNRTPGVNYPHCFEGERACPPEDIGGVWGYADFLEAIGDPNHDEHARLLKWAGGSFDAQQFDPAAATKRMMQGLPEWRE
jgi:hypothetical protein